MGEPRIAKRTSYPSYPAYLSSPRIRRLSEALPPHFEEERCGAEDADNAGRPPSAAVDDDELEVFARFDGEVDVLPHERVVDAQMMAARFEVLGHPFAKHEGHFRSAVEADDHLPLADVFRVFAADGDRRPKIVGDVAGADAWSCRRRRTRAAIVLRGAHDGSLRRSGTGGAPLPSFLGSR